ncbi:hypothetical protein SCP_0304830 [Sparassis crispa]|uniref:Impact N-terminal domain-containing protein n=1 Tax=Sparassis crispa TaxID=139825 RepID=A0A401GEZ4_9APHY|nr:hypothetical protein SCP_0304830 [Sparassis crispa]GBE80764.1 hypothetical protein SCP_0304830 [Sparassis crispa]
MSNLDSFVCSSKPVPKSLATSQEIRDRGSTFVANVFAANSPQEARAAVAYLRNVIHGQHRASHEVAAWRCMVLKAGKSGLGGPNDFELQTGCEDDGEKYADGRVLKVMQEESVIDAVVVVSRWYGGIMLGPARFAHFESCAREVCRTFRLQDDVETCIATLSSLDDILGSLRDELAKLLSSDTPTTESSTTNDRPIPKNPPDYTALRETLDIKKAKRLVTARENAIKSVKAALRKAKEKHN